MKFIDIAGNEIQVGDYVATATVRGLQRTLVKSISLLPEERWHNKDVNYYKVALKSITIGLKFKRDGVSRWSGKRIKAVITGNSSQLCWVRKDTPIDERVYKVNVVKLGTFEQLYTKEEQDFIRSTKTKI